jgi:cell division protein FtsW
MTKENYTYKPVSAFINTHLKGDLIIWTVVFLLSIISILAVYSSTGTLAYKYQAGNTSYYMLKHMVIIFMGIGLMYLAHLIKYTYYSRIAQIALYIAIPLLLFTLITGTNIHSASRWITVPGLGMTFQTSDFAKLALIMYIARLLSKKQDNIKDFKEAFLPIMIPVIIVCGLILPANLSTSVLLFATCFVLMFIGRINLKYLGMLVVAGVVVLTQFIIIAPRVTDSSRVKTWINRIENFTNGDKSTASQEGNYQSEQAKISIATGGVFGKAPGKSVQRNFLPHPYSDFIYAIIIEEYGLVGGVVVILLYLILLFRSIRIASKTENIFGSLLAVGCCFSLIFQAMINMGVAVNLLPVTGQALPLVSMGGTSVWFTSIAIGIILSVSKEIDNLKPVQCAAA